MRHIIIAVIAAATIGAPAAAQRAPSVPAPAAHALAQPHAAPHLPSPLAFHTAPAHAAAPLFLHAAPTAHAAPTTHPAPTAHPAPNAHPAPAAHPTPLNAAAPHAAPRLLPPEGWAPQDPADSLWRNAREALNRGDHARAARLYNEIRTATRYARSEYRVPSYYWEAFARERMSTTSELNTALTVLAALRREHPNYTGMADATRLEASINAQLAERGDARAQTRVNQTVSQVGAQNQQCDETQMYALEALMHMSTAEAMPILKRVMERRGCDSMREKAIFIIAQKRGPEAEEIMLNAVRNDPSAEVREQAVFWLSQVNSDRAVDALDNIIRTSTDANLLEKAVFALSQNRSARAGELLRELATRTNTPARVKRDAIFWLAQRNDPSVGPLLRTMYGQTTDQELKEVILFAASQHRTDENGAFLSSIALNDRENIELRKKALFLAGQQRALPVNRLAELYRSMPDVEMKKQIIFTLTQTRDPEAVAQLIEIARAERNTELRKDAIFWLGQSKDPRAARFLAEIIGG